MSFGDKIRLNFFPLNDQNFEFKVWRKIYEDTQRMDGAYQNTLPKNSNLDEREKYWIFFQPMTGFEEFNCKSNYNNNLTIFYLYYLLKTKSLETFSNDQIQTYEKFRKSISYVIKKYDQGDEVVWLEPYFFSPTQKFGYLLDFKFNKKREIPFSIQVQRLSLSLDNNFRSNRNFYLDKYNKIQNFLTSYGDKVFPLTTNLNNNLLLDSKLEEIEVTYLESKKYLFANEEIDYSQFKGISSFGPLKKLDTHVSFFYIFKEEHRNLVEDLKLALKGELYGIMFNGMSNVFKFEITKEYEHVLDNYSETELQSTIQKIIELNNSSDGIVFPVFIEDKDNQDAYYFMKYNLIKEKIPLQAVTFQLIGRRNQFKWSVSNIALQIFAKLGGIPWKVSQKSKSLIFGIGQSHQKHDGQILKYFTYSVCTDSSGIYKKVNILGRSDDESTYLSQLKENVISTINENLDNEFSSCVLHIPFKVKIRELESIHEAINTLKNTHSNIDFIVLRINTRNRFFGYANTNSLIPYEGSYIEIKHNPKQYLVWFDGLQKNNESIFKQIQGPIYIEFYWSSKNLNDEERVNYLQEVLNLSGSNWSGFNSTKSPISILYCEHIAKYLKNFPSEIHNLEEITVPWFI